MKELFTNILNLLGQAWWVEIITDKPRCTYYFGPFTSAQEAETFKPGYLEDLEKEGAQGIQVSVKRCKPTELTIFDETEDLSRPGKYPMLSGQLQ